MAAISWNGYPCKCSSVFQAEREEDHSFKPGVVFQGGKISLVEVYWCFFLVHFFVGSFNTAAVLTCLWQASPTIGWSVSQSPNQPNWPLVVTKSAQAQSDKVVEWMETEQCNERERAGRDGCPDHGWWLVLDVRMDVWIDGRQAGTVLVIVFPDCVGQACTSAHPIGIRMIHSL